MTRVKIVGLITSISCSIARYNEEKKKYYNMYTEHAAVCLQSGLMLEAPQLHVSCRAVASILSSSETQTVNICS